MINLTKSHISRKLFPLALIFCLALTSILGLQTTGDRNTPSGVEPSPFFNVTLLVPSNNPVRIDWVDLIAEKLELIGIGITAIDVAPWVDAMARTVDHPGPYPIPTYDFGGYDIFFVGWIQETIEWLLVEELFSSAKFVPNGYNYYQYSSGTFDYELLDIDCTGWAHQQYIRGLQEILFEDLPSIPIVYPRDVYAMLCTVLPVGLCLWHNAFQPMDMWKKLGDTSFVYARPGYFNTTSICHPHLAESVADRQWLSQIYDSLLYPLNCTYPTWERRIAISHSHDNCTVWTVDIDPNAKWADGTPVTSDDVVFSYEAMMEPTLNSPYATLLDEHLDSVSAIDAYTVEFVLKEAYAFGELLLSYPLIPKHIWESVDYTDWETQAYTWATTDPSKIIGCGPFKLQQADDPSDTVILEKNIYFRDLLNYDEPNFETITFVRYADKAAALSALSIGEVDIVDARFDLELSELNMPGISYSIVPTLFVQELGVNMDHPYLGTGASCPIPGPDSAKHIRKAICNAIPRQEIINTFYGGLAGPGMAPCPEGCIGFHDGLMPCEFSIDIAKDHMRDAGFVYPEDTTTTSPTETETETPTETDTATGFLGIAFPTFVAILALAGGCTIIIWRRSKV